MARKKQYDYFITMKNLAANSAKAARVLQKLVADYSEANLAAKGEEIHRLEHEGDDFSQEIRSQLYDAFITPIDREDIFQITEQLDDILDGINATIYLFENLVVDKIRPRTSEFIELLVDATDATLKATEEFAKFKNSKSLRQLITHVKEVESQADRLYSELTRDLFLHEQNPVEIIKWKDVYDTLEDIADACEDAADIIASLVIKNS